LKVCPTLASASFVANGTLSFSSARSTHPFQAIGRGCKVAAASRAGTKNRVQRDTNS
jgi:hypothetical protein